jgi:NTE family protein
MALETSAALELRRAIDFLSSNTKLEGVAPATLEALAAGAVHFSLPAGDLLFKSGSMPDGVYLVASGRLGVRVAGSERWTAEIGRGEWVGESGWLLKERRSATVIALRDTELLLLPDALLDAVAAESTQFSLAFAQLCARRLRRSNMVQLRPRHARVFALVPNGDEVDVIGLATRLIAELERSGRAELVWDVRATTHTSAWFGRIEELNDYVVYIADPTKSAWTRQCCRQADLIVLIANARATRHPWPASVSCAAASRGARMELAICHEGEFAPGAASCWLKSQPVALHHHIINSGDLARVARLLTRRGVGLVLSGGGARGFAHLGVIRALAAGVAMGRSDEEMRRRYHRSFVATNPVNDYTFPLVALTRGRKVSRLLEREYGQMSIQDLRQPFFT